VVLPERLPVCLDLWLGVVGWEAHSRGQVAHDLCGGEFPNIVVRWVSGLKEIVSATSVCRGDQPARSRDAGGQRLWFVHMHRASIYKIERSEMPLISCKTRKWVRYKRTKEIGEGC
jgi:hypothetical protein